MISFTPFLKGTQDDIPVLPPRVKYRIANYVVSLFILKVVKRLCSIGPCIFADWLSIIAVISSPLSSFSIVRLSTKSLICNPGAGKSNVNTYFTQFLIKLNVSNLSSSPNG